MDPPPTPIHGRSLNRQVVLEEDEYTAALSHIIARDFFPSLVHLDATNNYLDALQSQDPHLINASVRRLEQISDTPIPSFNRRTPSRTPYNTSSIETPLRTPHALGLGPGPNKRPRLDSELNLDLFQARYTSEDNSSFTQILNDENRKRKERWAWAWDAQKRVEGQRDRMIEARERMLNEAPPATGVRERFMVEAPTLPGLITDGRESERTMVKVNEEKVNEGDDKNIEDSGAHNEHSGGVDVMAPKKDTRSAGVDGWRFKARNSLMFTPDADDSPYAPSVTTTEAEGDAKLIKYGNTRLPGQDHSSSTTRGHSAPPSPTRSRINAAITDTPYQPQSSTADNFGLVPNLPSPTASELGPTAVKQLMTWGTLNATPRIISQTDEPLPPPSTPFHIPAISSREAISHKLSNKASKSLRTKAGLLGLNQLGYTPGISKTPSGRKGNMAPPTWTPRRSEAAGNLTPAARRLLERSTTGVGAMRKVEATGRSGGWDEKEKDLSRVRWTPTPGSIIQR